MATQAYYTWDNAGRPWRLARPVAELAELAKQHPEITLVGTIGDESHLTDATPEDHTPFSIDEWPVEIGAYVVCAVDFGGPSVAVGAMCQKALREKPGWLKYLIWRGPVGKTGLRDVRRSWAYQEGSGHTSHAHWSIRTDWIDKSIGDYQLTEDDMGWTDKIPAQQWAQDQGLYATSGYNQGEDVTAAWHQANTNGNVRKLVLRQVPAILAGQAAILAAVRGGSVEEIQQAMRAELDAAAERERTERAAELTGLADRVASALATQFGPEVGQAAAREFAVVLARGVAPDDPAAGS